MLEQFLSFIKKNKLFDPKEKILLAVSGGLDSVVMAELFHRAKFKFAIAHCNFQLRGKESDGDEQFVKKLAAKYGVKFFSKHFDTEKEASDKKISIQMAARDLRYAWFIKTIRQQKYYKVAVAHNFGDSIETFLINLLRGTGIDGITGIPIKTPILIRPLLFSTRNEIEAFAKSAGLQHREDSSNLSDDYLRNRIRHKLIPVFKELNPKFEQTMSENISHFLFAQSLFEVQEIKLLNHLVKDDHHPSHIVIAELNKHNNPEQLLYQLIHRLGFNFTQCKEMLNENTATKSGKIFHGGIFRALRDRGKIILNAHPSVDTPKCNILKTTKKKSNYHTSLQLSFSDRKKNMVLPSSNIEHWLDAEQLKFPLILRQWKAGDYFFPLGMKNRKKLSDFFTDKKMNIFEKEKTYVLTSADQIVCLLGHRVDDRFKITDKTKIIYKVKVKQV